MKKILVLFVLLVSAFSAQANVMKTTVLKILEPDDEGVKIRVQDPVKESTAVAIYLRNTNQQFQQIMNVLKQSQSSGLWVVITTEQEGKLTVINKVSLN